MLKIINLCAEIDGKEILKDEMIEHYYLDRDIKWFMKGGHNIDKEPLLVNTINSWSLRPEAATEIENLFLASDYSGQMTAQIIQVRNSNRW